MAGNKPCIDRGAYSLLVYGFSQETGRRLTSFNPDLTTWKTWSHVALNQCGKNVKNKICIKKMVYMNTFHALHVFKLA